MSNYTCNKSSSFGVLDAVGTLFATLISIASGNSLGWAMFHAILGWFYVIYSTFTGDIVNGYEALESIRVLLNN